jgi:methyl-accepting chemotaxis protein
VSTHSALLASLKRHDRFMVALSVVNAAALAWTRPTALAWAGAALLVVVTALLAWRAGGSLLTRMVIALGNAAVLLGAEHVPGHGIHAEVLMPVTLCLLLPYRDWRPIAAGAGAFLLGELLLGHLDLGLLLFTGLALMLVWLAIGMQREAAERFELEFLINAMGRDGPIRLNLDVVRAESKVGLRLKHIQGRMLEALRLVRDATASVQGVSTELGGSAGELRERTEHTARGLQDAAMSLEQINVIVQDSAKASGEAKSLAISAAAQAEEGGALVGRMVQTMQDIDAASRRITDIIGSIDSIAFRTNILALNAAVEAARAGEAGRGFAVVATEVRMLAGRAADAAKEIRQLVGASLATVERGSREAKQAGTAMKELVQAVHGVGKVFENLSADSAEHAASIDVVTASVKELDQVTGRNLDVAVRGSEIAAELLQQAVQLGEVLSNFRLGDDAKVAELLASARAAAEEAQRVAASSVQRGGKAGSTADAGSVDFF